MSPAWREHPAPADGQDARATILPQLFATNPTSPASVRLTLRYNGLCWRTGPYAELRDYQLVMRPLHRRSIPRAVATALILLAQLQLLWVAAVHCHELPVVPLSATIQPASSTQQTTSAGADVQCPACNLIHQSAARAVAIFSAQRPTVSSRYLFTAFHVSARTCDLPVTRGRAPPLS